MKKLSLLFVVSVIFSLSAFAGEYLMNDTGKTVYGLTVTFSEPVTITGFGDVLMTVTPTGKDTSFTFSGRALEAWGGQWLNWEPASATLVSHQWLITSIWSEDEASKIAYAYLTEPRHCKGKGPFAIPLYLSIPPSTPTTDSFSISISDMDDILLVRADEVMCVGQLLVPEIPIRIELSVKRNGVRIGGRQSIYLENGYQAISLALTKMEGVSDVAPFAENFLRGATVTDVWGSYLYGTTGEEHIHTRNYFATTCDRLVEDGVRDVYVTTFFEYASLLPHPRLQLQGASGAGAISEKDMRALATTAHDRGLRLHVRFDIFSDKIDLSYLYAPKSADWINSFFDEYGALLLSEMGKAERCGVDGVVVGLEVSYVGYESLWGSRWKSLLSSIRSVFGGQIEYGLRKPDMDNYLTHRFPSGVFDDVDSFLWGPWDPMFSSYDDSLATLHKGLEKWVKQFRPFVKAIEKPLYLDGMFQSTDGYMVDGWHDVAIGLLGNTKPDFFEQSRGYEALFEVLATTNIFDGIVLYKYHWDDPFGPELPDPALARMDLSASVRNKPAEAIAKRWFGGEAGPQMPTVDETALAAMRRPWCQTESLPALYAPRDYPVLYTPGDYLEVGTSVHAVEETDQGIVALDWMDGTMYSVSLDNQGAEAIVKLPRFLYDLVVEDSTIYSGFAADSNNIQGYDMTTGAPCQVIRVNLDLDWASHELWGIEIDGDILYLLSPAPAPQELIAYDRSTGTVQGRWTLPGNVRELIGLEHVGNYLFTMDWTSGAIYRIDLTGGTARLRMFIDVSRCIPQADRATGGFRGFHFGNKYLYVTTISGFAGEQSRIHLLKYSSTFDADIPE